MGAAASAADSDSSPDETLLQLKTKRAQLDASTDVSDSASSDAAPNSLTAAERATQRRKTRKPGVTDGRGRRVRGLLSTLGQVMATGNNELGAIKLLQASVVAKPGGLSKQCIKRWHAAFAGPSSALVDSVFHRVGHEHLDPIIAYNDAREQLPVSHANRTAPWLHAKRKPTGTPSAPSRSYVATGWGASATFAPAPMVLSTSAPPSSPCTYLSRHALSRWVLL